MVWCNRLSFFWVLCATVTSRALGFELAKPECQDTCGDLSIPYPFGTTEGCYLDENFLITCNSSFTPHKPFLRRGNKKVLNISLDGEMRIHTGVYQVCYTSNGSYDYQTSVAFYLSLKAFYVSHTRNKYFAIGCDTFSLLYVNGKNHSRDVTTGCSSVCAEKDSDSDGSCSGNGCCETTIPKGVYFYQFNVGSYNDHMKVWSFNPCSYSFLGEASAFNFSSDYLSNFTQTAVPTVLDWAVGNHTCEESTKNSTSYACKSMNSYCLNSKNGLGYRCKCHQGFEGNPYLPYGCQDIDECQNPTLNKCERACNNTMGSFACSCPLWHNGDGFKGGTGCTADQLLIKIIIGIGISLLVLVICSSWLYWGYKKKKLMQLKHKFFKQNGGLMLQSRLSQHEGSSTDTAKIYTTEELEKATKKFDESMIVGQGGFGTVYKGILANGKVVAIKKSKLVDKGQIEQFINEVVVLYQINHRNVVRLLGCCLETEVPLLVYEFVSNGTLFDHIHSHGEVSILSWSIRVRIAAQIAGVLAYLHSVASPPIIHRDVKSTNILLDENYVAKVSDFGASRLVPIDHMELSTLVQGTLGYLDPEYLLTNQLTEKSDVYSFGVVVVELLTGKKPLCFDRMEKERSLANYFLACLKEDRLFEILEESVVLKEGNFDQVKQVANLAKKCLRIKGENRPDMQQVAMELEGLRRIIGKENHPYPWDDAQTSLEEARLLLSDNENSSDKFNNFGRGHTHNADTCGVFIQDRVVFSVSSGR